MIIIFSRIFQTQELTKDNPQILPLPWYPGKPFWEYRRKAKVMTW